MKRFTFTILGLLLFLGGVFSQDVTTLYLNGGADWDATDGSNEWHNYTSDITYTSGNVKLKNKGWNPNTCGLTGSNWIATVNADEIHTFTVTLSEAPGNNHFVLAGGNPTYGEFDRADENGHYKVIQRIAADATSASIELTKTYDKVYILNTEASNEILKIASITRTISTPSSVAAPTITPASGTYDGDLSVTITPGEGNDKVTYSVTGSNEDASHTNIDITAETTINLTGSSTITVTATGYNGVNASSPVTNTYTYGVPSGKTSASITYYALSALLMGDGTSRAFYDFEDGVTMPGADNSGNPLRVSGNFTGGTSNLSIVDCDADHISATGSTKCLKIDFSGKNQEQTNNYDSQIALYFNGTLTEGHTYYVHFWTKAETHVNDKANTLVEFQKNGKDWNRSHQNTDVDYDTSWHEYMYTIQPSRGDASMMCFNLGKVHNNVLYIDDIAVFDATDDTTPVSFSDLKSTAVISSSDFSDYAAGDYIHLNVTGSPSEIGYKSHATNDEYKVPYLAEYTNLEQTNGNWLIPVTSDIKSNGLSIKGYSMTLSSVDIYKKKSISEATNNTISSKEDHVVVELTRSFVANTWNTVCLPFTLTSDQATQLFGSGYQLAEFTSVSGTTMKFTTAASFEAGVPYLVKPTIDVSNASPIVLVDVDITAKTPQTVPHGDYSFVGTFSTKTFSAGECNTSLFVAAGNELKTPEYNSTLKSLRCYFTVPSVAAARTFSLGFDEEGGTTSINTVNGSGVMVNGYYNLNGQRVAKPTKGLFIVNGKKVVIK